MLPFSSAHSPRQVVPMEQDLESRNESVTAAAAMTGVGMGLRQRLFAPNSSMLRGEVRAPASFSSVSSSSSTSVGTAAAAAASSCKSAVSINSRGSWFSLQGRSKRRISFGGEGEVEGGDRGRGSEACARSEDEGEEGEEGAEGEGGEGGGHEGGCATPRARECRIPRLFSCPGAPRKRKLQLRTLPSAAAASSQHYQFLHHAPSPPPPPAAAATDSSSYRHVPAFCRFASSPSRLNIPQAQH